MTLDGKLAQISHPVLRLPLAQTISGSWPQIFSIPRTALHNKMLPMEELSQWKENTVTTGT